MTPDPFEVEQNYQNLVYLLSYPSTPLRRLRLVASFLQSLQSTLPHYESYVLEVGEKIPSIVDDLPSGNDPEALEPLYCTIRSTSETVASLAAVPGFTGMMAVLRSRLAESHLYVGSLEQAVQILEDKVREEQPGWLRAVLDPTGDRHTLLRRAIAAARRESPATASSLQELYDRWMSTASATSGVLYVPAVEEGLAGNTDRKKSGMLRRFSLEITASARSGTDQLHTDVAIFGAEKSSAGFGQTPLAAARAALKANFPRAKAQYVVAHLSMAPKFALHEGQSADLAIAALHYSALLGYTNQRVRYLVRSTVAVTGRITEGGDVLPVDDDTLQVKVRAAFYSHVEALVVPKSQENAAEEYLRRLQDSYPRRRLTLIGVSYLSDFFYDLRIIDRRIISPAAHVAGRVWQHRISVGLAGVIIVLVLALARILYGPLDKNPMSADWTGEQMLLRNAGGEVVDRITVGQSTALWGNSKLRGNDQLSIVCFMDMGQDGVNEIFYIQSADLNSGEPFRIVCAAVGRREPLWTKSSARLVSFPLKADAKGTFFLLSSIRGGDFDGDGTPELFVTSNSLSSFPGLIVQLDARDGHEIGCYTNVGHVNNFTLADINGDGKIELLACGPNNAYSMAAVYALDPRRIDGCSPTRGAYLPKGIPRAQELFYALIPRTVVGLTFADESSTNVAQYLEVNAERREFSVTIDDACVRPGGDSPVTEAHVKYTFDGEFRLKGIDTGSDYDRLAQKLRRAGRIASIPDRAYFESYADTILVWTNDRFVNLREAGKNGLHRR